MFGAFFLTPRTSAIFALLAHGFNEEPVTVPQTGGAAKIFLETWQNLDGVVVIFRNRCEFFLHPKNGFVKTLRFFVIIKRIFPSNEAFCWI